MLWDNENILIMEKYFWPLAKNIAKIFIGVAIVFILTLVAGAFTEPTQSPPAGNVNPPLNTSATTQTKTGNLTFPLMYDSDDGGYYVDPAANSVFYRIYASYLNNVSTINGGSPITSSNIGSQSVSYANSCGSAGSASVADRVNTPSLSFDGRIHNGEIMPMRYSAVYGGCSPRGAIAVTRCTAYGCNGRDILCYCANVSWGPDQYWSCIGW
jgi:hypothetical protein